MEKELSRRSFLTKMMGIGAVAIAGSMLLTTGACNSTTSDLGVYNVNESMCTGCKDCLRGCSHNAITVSGGVATISETRCAGCGKCVPYCKQNAISRS